MTTSRGFSMAHCFRDARKENSMMLSAEGAMIKARMEQSTRNATRSSAAGALDPDQCGEAFEHRGLVVFEPASQSWPNTPPSSANSWRALCVQFSGSAQASFDFDCALNILTPSGVCLGRPPSAALSVHRRQLPRCGMRLLVGGGPDGSVGTRHSRPGGTAALSRRGPRKARPSGRAHPATGLSGLELGDWKGYRGIGTLEVRTRTPGSRSPSCGCKCT